MIEHMDTAIGRIIHALDQSELQNAGNTLIVFLSDNGGPANSAYNGDLRGAKGVAYEGGVRVPFFMSWPGCLAQQADLPFFTDEWITMTDLYNTLLSLSPDADIQRNEESHGRFHIL